jgi:hypothetical protein
VKLSFGGVTVGGMDSTNAWNPTNRAITKIATIEITLDTTDVKACPNVGFKERRHKKEE